MIEQIDEFVSKLASQSTIRSLSRGLLYMMPFILMGSVVIALLNLPIPFYQNFLLHEFGGSWKAFADLIHKATLQIMAITSLIAVSYAFAEEKELIKSGEISAIVIVITAFASFIAFNASSTMLISVEEVGSSGMFKAIVTALISCECFCFFYKWSEKITSSEIIDYSGNMAVRVSFKAFLPAFLTICIFAEMKMLIGMSGWSNEILLSKISETWMNGQNYISALIIILTTHILWFLGIHGGNVIMDAMSSASPLLSTTSTVSIFTKEFFDIYVYLGGAGATMGLLLALLLVGKKSSENRLAKVSILPAIFNINEVLIFGLPIIFNPYYFIPFICAPVVLSLTAWISVRTGLAPPVIHPVEWTTPIFLSGYVSTGSLSGSILQAVNLILATLIYIPFVRRQEKHQRRVYIEIFQKLGREIQYIQMKQSREILKRHDEVGTLARALSEELKRGLKNNTLPVHLEYQPKVNCVGKVMGAEALLRWEHPAYGYVSPLIILTICDEANMTNALGKWIMEHAFYDLRRWHEMGYPISLSVNLSPLQLQQDEDLIQTVESCIAKVGVPPDYMELELTENAAVDPSESTRKKLKKIEELGIRLSIDDFGMGHSSLLYLCDFFVSIVKIDAALVKTIVIDENRQKIVKSILSLCAQMHVKTIAEGVETKEQVQLLQGFGCEFYQGFYFSKSLKFESFIEYINQNGLMESK